jgi:hypothetical protein
MAARSATGVESILRSFAVFAGGGDETINKAKIKPSREA